MDEEGNPIDPPAEQPPAAEEEEAKAPVFNPADYKWSITNRVSKNLPQLFKDLKGSSATCEEKPSTSFDDVAQEAVSMCLDQFCARVQADAGNKHIY